jgi:hypothetical protein
MSISQNLCVSYKQEILSGIHQDTHEYKIALFKNTATLSKLTTSYSGLTEEVSGGGYIAGGNILTGFSTSVIGDIAILDFTSDPEWVDVSFTARGALIYNNSLVEKNAIAVLDFGADYTCSEGTFSVVLPFPGEATALIRVV